MRIWHLSPLRCAICRHYACYEELPICKYCLSDFSDLFTERCKKCGLTAVSCECDKNTRCLFFFNLPESKRAVYRIKTNTDERIIRFFAELMVKVNGINPKSYDIVTYVPRIRRNIRRYGFDQSKELAKAISDIFGIPLVTTLERVGGVDQKLLSRAERIKNIKGRYNITHIPPEKYSRILLIDDVTTTGATLEACANLLRDNVADRITKLVVAKTILQKSNLRTE